MSEQTNSEKEWTVICSGLCDQIFKKDTEITELRKHLLESIQKNIKLRRGKGWDD